MLYFRFVVVEKMVFVLSIFLLILKVLILFLKYLNCHKSIQTCTHNAFEEKLEKDLPGYPSYLAHTHACMYACTHIHNFPVPSCVALRVDSVFNEA